MAPEVIVCETVKDNPYDYKVRYYVMLIHSATDYVIIPLYLCC